MRSAAYRELRKERDELVSELETAECYCGSLWERTNLAEQNAARLEKQQKLTYDAWERIRDGARKACKRLRNKISRTGEVTISAQNLVIKNLNDKCEKLRIELGTLANTANDRDAFLRNEVIRLGTENERLRKEVQSGANR